MDSLYIVMPAYNEEETIESVVRAWYPILTNANSDSRLVVADSGSTDSTHSILTGLKKELPQLEILSDCDKQHGPKLIAMYNYAISKGATYVFQTDSDGQTRPEEFKDFWDIRNDYSAIIGNRVIRGDGKLRKFVENIVCILIAMIFKVHVKDANAPFRLMKCDVLSKYMDRFEADYNLPNIMLVVFFSFNKEKICFKEITFQPRQKGKSSINLKKLVIIGIKAISFFLYYKKEYKM